MGGGDAEATVGRETAMASIVALHAATSQAGRQAGETEEGARVPFLE